MTEIYSLVKKPLPPGAHIQLRSFYSSWGSETLSELDLLFWKGQSSFILDRQLFDNHMLQAAIALGVNFIPGAYATCAIQRHGNWNITLMHKNKRMALKAGFIVEATGNVSTSVIWSDVQRYFIDKLICLSVNIIRPIKQITMVEAVSQGWSYTAPSPKAGQTIAIFTDADLLPQQLKRNYWVRDVLNRTFHLKNYVSVDEDDEILYWNTRTSIRSVIWRNCWLAVGDAAWSLDPLSGTGLQRAIGDGIEAANAIAQSIYEVSFEPLKRHALSRAHNFSEQREVQKSYYSLEKRWSESAFWKRRL